MSKKYWKLANYSVILLSFIVIHFDSVISFKIFPQSIFLWKWLNEHNISLEVLMFYQVEHAIRFIITYPALSISNLLDISPDIIFRMQTNVCLILTTYNIRSAVSKLSRIVVLEQISIALLLAFLIIAMFMNGRMIYAWLGFSMMLKAIFYYEYDLKDSSFIRRIILALMLSTVSTGSFFVVCAIFYVWLFYYMCNRIKNLHMERTTVIYLFHNLFLCLIIYVYDRIYKNDINPFLWCNLFILSQTIIALCLDKALLESVIVNALIWVGYNICVNNIILLFFYMVIVYYIIILSRNKDTDRYNMLLLPSKLIPIVFVSFYQLFLLVRKVYYFYADGNDIVFNLKKILLHGIGKLLFIKHSLLFTLAGCFFVYIIYRLFRIILHAEKVSFKILSYSFLFTFLAGFFGYAGLSMIVVPFVISLIYLVNSRNKQEIAS